MNDCSECGDNTCLRRGTKDHFSRNAKCWKPKTNDIQGEDAREIPRSIWEGVFNLGGVNIKCHVLDNGQRIMDADDVAKFFKAMEGSSFKIDQIDMDNFARWQKGLN